MVVNFSQPFLDRIPCYTRILVIGVLLFYILILLRLFMRFFCLLLFHLQLFIILIALVFHLYLLKPPNIFYIKQSYNSSLKLQFKNRLVNSLQSVEKYLKFKIMPQIKNNYPFQMIKLQQFLVLTSFMIPSHISRRQPVKLRPPTFQITIHSNPMNNSIKNFSSSVQKTQIIKRQILPTVSFSPGSNPMYNYPPPSIIRFESPINNKIYTQNIASLNYNSNLYKKFPENNKQGLQPKQQMNQKIASSPPTNTQKESLNYDRIVYNFLQNKEQNKISERKQKNQAIKQEQISNAFEDQTKNKAIPFVCPFCLQKMSQQDKQIHKQNHRNRIYNLQIITIPEIRGLPGQGNRTVMQIESPAQVRDNLIDMILKVQNKNLNLQRKNNMIKLSMAQDLDKIQKRTLQRQEYSPDFKQTHGSYAFPIEKRRRIPFHKSRQP